MSKIPAGLNGNAIDHNLPFEPGYGFTAKGNPAALIAALGQSLALGTQVIGMADAAHALVLGAASSAQSQLTAGVLLIDPASSGAAEVLTYADTEAELDGLFNLIINTGDEAITVNNDGAAQVGHIPAQSAAIITCDGTSLRCLNLGAAGFASAEQTGTGAGQNVAHGLGQLPSYVWTSITEAGGTIDVAEGAHTTTNLVFTVTSGVKFKAFALL